MNQVVQMQDAAQPRSITNAMASRYGMEPAPFEATLRATVVPDNCSREQFAAFLLVAKEYGLNPITKEIYAFPARGGGIQPIVSIDGWMNIINNHPQFDGMEFKDSLDDENKLVAITCKMYRKDRSHPVEVTEYLSECSKNTDTWKTWPARMLRHKAAIQCARYCFGFSGIVDEDEHERAQSVVKDITPPPPPKPTASAPAKTGGTEPNTPPPPPQSAPPQEQVAETPAVEPEILEPVDYDAMIEDLETRLKQAKNDPDLQAEIWASEIEVKIEDGDIFPPDAERLKSLIKNA